MLLGGLLLQLAMTVSARAAVDPADSARLDRGAILVSRPNSGMRGVAGGQARGVIEAPIGRVWEVLNKSNEFSEYMPRYLVSWLVDSGVLDGLPDEVSRVGVEKVAESLRLDSWIGDTVYFYNVLDMPFPISDRWYLLRMTRDHASHKIDWTQVVGNTRVNFGSWHLEPLGVGDRTVATYTTFSDPGIMLPGFVTRIGLDYA
ncbi:MAG: hypothetical protein JSU73_01820, partial [candidate division WOR-3 bacterium]